MNWVKKMSFAMLVWLAITSASEAQMSPPPMEPLAQAIGESASSYPLVRCSALFASLAQWTGAGELGQDLFDTYFATARSLAYAAAAIMVDEADVELEAAGAIIDRDLETISEMYLARFEANYAAEGEAFAQDALVQGDLELCIQITQFVLEGSA